MACRSYINKTELVHLQHRNIFFTDSGAKFVGILVNQMSDHKLVKNHGY
jgi:hypothetical protein